MKRPFKFFILLIVASAAGAVTSLGLHVTRVLPAQPSVDMQYSDFVSIMLTAVSLLITVLGLFVAAVGVIGWSTMESKLRSHSVAYFSEQLSKDGPLRKEFEDLIIKIASTGIEDAKPQPAENEAYRDDK